MRILLNSARLEKLLICLHDYFYGTVCSSPGEDEIVVFVSLCEPHLSVNELTPSTYVEHDGVCLTMISLIIKN